MRPIQHKSNTRVLAAPKGHDQNDIPVAAVPITDTMVSHKAALIVFYDLTSEERQQIADGALIGVWVIGVTAPPMALTVQVDK